MDLADDIAYSVHDVEDGVVAGRIDLTSLDAGAVWSAVRGWYLPEADEEALAEALARMRAVASWPSAAYDGSRRGLASLKNLTSDLIGRFCAAARSATFAAYDGPLLRHQGDLVVPEESLVEMAVLKGIAAHYVMQADDRVLAMEHQRELLAELVAAVLGAGPSVLERPFADDWSAAADDAARRRAVVDQIASLTDASAVAWHARLV